MEENKTKVLMGMDGYLPDVDGVINCMHNYCLNSCRKVNLLAIAPKAKRGYVDNLPYRILRCKSIKIPFMKLRYGTPSSDHKFRNIVMAEDFDIIHVHSPFAMSKFCIDVAKEKNIPIVATFHTNFRPIFQSIFKNKALAEAWIKELGRIYNKMDEIFVCSPKVAEQARSFGYKGKITYLPFGTEFKKADNTTELINKCNNHFNLKEDELVFIFVGRIMPLKRIDFIIQSLKILKDKGHKFKFYVCGKGMHLETLKALAKTLDLQKEVIFLGFVDRDIFPCLYARANLLLFPSLYDNFGLVKVEAAAFATAGVFIADSQAGYGITDGVNGYLAEDSLNSFAAKIEEAISDREQLKQVGINASNELYINWEQCTNLLIKRYDEIINDYKNKKFNKMNLAKIKRETLKLKSKKEVKKRAYKLNSILRKNATLELKHRQKLENETKKDNKKAYKALKKMAKSERLQV